MPITVARNPLLQTLPYGTMFHSYYDEMIACVPHEGAAYYDFDDLESYINAEVLLPRDGDHIDLC